MASDGAGARCRHLGLASYILIKLMNGVGLGSIARYALLTLATDVDAKAFKALCAALGIIKLLHVGLTAAAVLWLLSPRRLAGLTLTTLATFLAFLTLLCLRVGSPGAGGVVDAGLVALALALAVALQAMDATMDALFLEQKPYVQGSRKVASVIISLASIAQLWLPPGTLLLPGAVLAASALVLALWVARGWWTADASLRARVANASSSARTHAVPPGAFVMFMVTVTVGGNGEQLLDALVNVDIDDAVAGGKVVAATAKETVTAVCNAFTFATYFLKNYRAKFAPPAFVPATPGQVAPPPVIEEGRVMMAELQRGVTVLLLWAIVQIPRLYVAGGKFAKLPSGVIVGLVTADKISGNLAEDALSNIQSHWLNAVAVPLHSSNHSRKRPSGWLSGILAACTTALYAATAPVACQSYGEIVDALTGSAVKIFVEVGPGDGEAHGLVALALWLRANVHAVVVCLVVFAVIAHVRMASVALAAQDSRIGAYLATRGPAKPLKTEEKAGHLDGATSSGNSNAAEAAAGSAAAVAATSAPSSKKDD